MGVPQEHATTGLGVPAVDVSVSMAASEKKKRNHFFTGLSFLFWLAVLGFIAYRASLPSPDRPGNVYLIHSKFNGYQNRILQPGQYYISWQNLLPGNVSLLAIPNRVQKLRLQRRFSLPSAGNYQLLLPTLVPDSETQNNPFEYRVSISLSYRFRPNELLGLNEKVSGLSAAGSPAHIGEAGSDGEVGEARSTVLSSSAESLGQNLSLRLERRLSRELADMFSENVAPASADVRSLTQQLETIVSQEFAELNLLSLEVEQYQQPDLELYATVRQYYHSLLQELSSESLSRLLEQQNSRIDQELYLQNIERLGEILTRYPVLIQYLAITAEDPNNALNLRSSILQSIKTAPSFSE